MEPPGEKMWRWLAPVIVALVGAIARQANDYREDGRFDFWDFVCRLVIAGFAGMLVAMFCSEYQLSQQWTGLISGIGGFFAVETIHAIRRIVRGRFGL